MASTATSTASTRWRQGRFALLSIPDGKLTLRKDELPSPSYMPSPSKQHRSSGVRMLSQLIPRRRRALYVVVSFLLFFFTWHSSDLFDGYDEHMADNARAFYLARHGRTNGTLAAAPYVPTTDMEHLRRWIRYNAEHGLDSFDRLSFAQMGFQTAMYARVLGDKEVPTSVLQEFEEKLWRFVPGLAGLRAIHGHEIARNNDTSPGLSAPLSSNNALTTPSTATTAKQASEPSRGIVIVTGNHHFRYTLQSIASIREGHQCDIPIEVYFCGTDDLSAANKRYLESAFRGVRVIDMLDLDIYDESFVELQGGQWAMKPFAMMATNFTEVILADADTVFLSDPHDFFTEQGYKETGTLFFHDRYLPTWGSVEIAEFLKEQLGHRGPSERLRKSNFYTHQLSHLQESGLVVMNKSRAEVFAALLFTLWQNSAAAREEVTYNIFYGEKESYWLAYELSGFAYHFSPFWAGAIGSEESAHADGFCSDHQLHLFNAETTVHKHKDAAPEVEKRRSGKAAWLNGSMVKNKFHSRPNDFLDVKESVWAMDGSWEYVQSHGKSTFCLSRFTRRPMEKLDMHIKMDTLLTAGKRATENMVQLMELDE